MHGAESSIKGAEITAAEKSGTGNSRERERERWRNLWCRRRCWPLRHRSSRQIQLLLPTLPNIHDVVGPLLPKFTTEPIVHVCRLKVTKTFHLLFLIFYFQYMKSWNSLHPFHPLSNHPSPSICFFRRPTKVFLNFFLRLRNQTNFYFIFRCNIQYLSLSFFYII
jgi:hypothetical protein